MVKHQQRLWIRAIDGFLPKDRSTFTVIELYRGRAMIRTGLLGALLNPFLILFEANAWDVWQQATIALVMIVYPVLLMWLYRKTGRLKLCSALYIGLTSAMVGWAQLASGTIHALYWLWFPFLIVFCVLLMGVKDAAIYATLVTMLCALIFRDNLRAGHSLGTFASMDALLANSIAQVMAIQICFILLMTAYDAIRNRAEVRAVMLHFTDTEADRLAAVGERMGSMAQDLNEQLNQFHGQLLHLDVLAKRSDTKVEDLQKLVAELQARTESLSEIADFTRSA